MAKGDSTFATHGDAVDVAKRIELKDGTNVRIFRDELAGPLFSAHWKLLADIDRPVEPPDGWRYCVDITCGIELRDQHTTRACRKHREHGATREGVKPLQTVTHPLTFFSTIDQAARDSIAEKVARNRREGAS